MTQDTPLRTRLREVGRRLWMIGTAAGLLWGLAGVTVLLIAGAWFDLLWELAPPLRIAACAIAALGGAVLLGLLLCRTAAAARPAPVAWRLDRAGQTGGQVITGLDLEGPGPGTGSPDTAELTSGMARMAVDRAAAVAGEVPITRAAPAKSLRRPLGSLALLLAGVGLLVICLPRLARTQWSRFTDPFGDVPPYSRTQFVVEPRGAKVLYGSMLEIHATPVGAPVEQIELVLEGEDGHRESLPMFPEPDGRWRSVLERVTEPAEYFVRAYRARSRHYGLQVITVPRIESARFTITPPKYTHEAPYEGPLPKDGLAGLPGTKVQIRATSNRPLSGGVLTVSGEGTSVELPMKPTSPGGREVLGEFEIAHQGKFQFQVIDVDGQSSLEPFGGAITLLADERPFIRMTSPSPMSLATPQAALPAVLSAEDDYGISRVQLFRSLNDSRALAMDIELPNQPRRRAYESVRLPLAGYGLEPGDIIKLFGRVEDTDPAGPKGSESSVVTVRIISQEDFERMLRARKGLEMLLSKYREAQRRMEAVAEQIERLRKKLAESPPEGKVADEVREQLRRLLRRLRKESEAIRRAADHQLPYDIDKNLTPQLEQLAQVGQQAARQLEKLDGQAELVNEEVARQLEDLAKKLGAQRKQLGDQAMVPLELLADVMPLLADQSRFVTLVLRQIDLAERLKSLKGHDGEDDPALKVRMRDLQDDQQQIRQELTELLEDILDHVEQVPDRPEFQKLVQTAVEFVRKVESSGASEAMDEAAGALAEFSGTRGYRKAQEAADILAKFLKLCEGIGTAGRGCLAFQPSLSTCLGQTIEQLLAEMATGSGSGGFGGGTGGDGYSARRGPGRNLGLYGSIPGITEALGGGGGADPAYPDAPGTPGQPAANPDQPTGYGVPGRQTAGGIGEGAIPARYRRRVGQYFQRIAEELNER